MIRFIRGTTLRTDGHELRSRSPLDAGHRAPTVGVSFAAAGWLQSYLFGSAKGLQEYGLHRLDGACFAGASAGGLAAAGLALGFHGQETDWDQVMSYALDCARRCRAGWRGTFHVRRYVEGCLDTHGALERFPAARGRLQVVITELLPTPRRRTVTRFSSAACLRSALLASCAVVPFAGPPVWREGRLSVDGALSGVQPRLQRQGLDRVVTVNPFFFSRADIRPSRHLPPRWALRPPGPDAYRASFELGYQDTLAWIQRTWLPRQPRAMDGARLHAT